MTADRFCDLLQRLGEDLRHLEAAQAPAIPGATTLANIAPVLMPPTIASKGTS